jgi:hypothetical protein
VYEAYEKRNPKFHEKYIYGGFIFGQRKWFRRNVAPWLFV